MVSFRMDFLIVINKNVRSISLVIILVFGVAFALQSQVMSSASKKRVAVIDTFHYSKTFGDIRKYRIFLPSGYDQDSEKRYPVIYFFHGWAQRYFGEMGIGYSHYDRLDDNGGDNMEAFVKKRDVIIVKIDGSNQFPSGPLNLTPWNIGTVKSFRQFPIYFEELVDFIDQGYLTISDRQYRAVSGLSMGGFMSFWVSGKYPHLLSSVGNFCGSLEFMVGPYEFPVEYNHINMHDNYEGVNVRMHYGTEDRLRYYHQDLNKIWPQVMDHYHCQIYEASHITCGMGDMFESIYQSFINPLPVPTNWHHIDVYPSFDIWGYEVSSDRIRSGFTIFKNVNKRGFNSAVRGFLPDGELMSEVDLSIRTPAIYKANTEYSICDHNARTGDYIVYTTTSDSDGIITIDVDGNEHYVGINEISDDPNISLLSLQTDNIDWLQFGRDVDLSIKLVNKGQLTGRNLDLELSSLRSTVEVKKSHTFLSQIKPGHVAEERAAFTIHIESDTVEIVRLLITVSDPNGNIWKDHYDLRVRNDEDNLEGELVVADGQVLTVVSEAVDSVTEIIGVGNGDGIANPGESIVLLIRNKGKLYRTNAFTTDEYINPNFISLRTSDSWANYDHIGPSAKFTTPVIGSDCPDGKEILFWLEYWLPNVPAHIIKRGVVKVKVEGNLDETAPVFKWLQVKNDQSIELAAYDAAGIKEVKIKMIPDKEASTIRYVRWDMPESFELKLNDQGFNADNFGGDSIFSGRIRGRASYVYRAEITLTDVLGNTVTQEYDKTIFIQDLR
ncbi:MAG: hypothetical protein HKN87_20625 [Saprospiraceae bacterium]|nr:hypothetical protein [Saprospiraceae bacterium]